jgi:hypothetical protein
MALHPPGTKIPGMAAVRTEVSQEAATTSIISELVTLARITISSQLCQLLVTPIRLGCLLRRVTCKNLRFGGTCRFLHQGDKLCDLELHYLQRAYAAKKLPTTRRNNPDDTIRHPHRRENLKSYITPTVPSSLSQLRRNCTHH